MENLIAASVLLVIVGLAMAYVIRAKKGGQKCIGCPDGCCAAKSGNKSCGCGAET